MTQPVPVTTLQFNEGDATSAKLRRLVQDLVTAEQALNSLISAANSTVSPDDTVPKHVLANTAGLGADHTASGLTVGQVLKAISATNAAFSQLKFSDLAGSDVSDAPSDGEFMQFIDGYWVASAAPPGGSSGANIGGGAGIYASNSGAVLQFKTLLYAAGLLINAVGANSLQFALDPVPATAALLPFTTLLQGLVPPPGAVNGFFLRDDGTWQAISAPTQFILAAGWNSASGAIPVASTVAQDLEIPYGCTLQEVLIQTQGGTGSCTVTLGTQAFPVTSASDITGGVPPAISSAASYANSTLAGWTILFAQKAMIRATLTVNSGFTSVKILLRFK